MTWHERRDGEGSVAVPGGTARYRVVGAERRGAPLLVVHGGPGAPPHYLEPLAELADERPVIFHDQLGCGASDRPTDPGLWDLARYVEELACVVTALGAPRLHLLGQSWGALLAATYLVERRPAGVASLVLSGPLLDARRWVADQRRLLAEMPAAVQRAVEEAERSGAFEAAPYQEATMAYYRRHLCRLDPWPGSLQRTFQELSVPVYLAMWGPSEFTCTGTLREADVSPRLGELRVPVLFTCGRHDEATPASTAHFAGLVPGATLLVLEDASHQHHLEQPGPYLAAVREHLRRAELAAGQGCAGHSSSIVYRNVPSS